MRKLIRFFFVSFRRKRKLESSVFIKFRIDWTPVFTGVTAKFNFFMASGNRGREDQTVFILRAMPPTSSGKLKKERRIDYVPTDSI